MRAIQTRSSPKAVSRTEVPPEPVDVVLLMEALPRQQVEFIDELVFPEGWEAALKLHLFGAQSGAAGCNPVLPPEGPNPNKNAAWRGAVQSGAEGFLVEAAGIEPAS